jgi:hypothetical protein
MAQSSNYINKAIDQEIDLAFLSQMQGAGVLGWIAEKTEQTVAFYSG